VGIGFEFPWLDFNDIRKNRNKKAALKQYINRSFFYEDLPTREARPANFVKDTKIFTLNTEELATLFHFPGRVSTTGTFERIQAQKAEPPANLPIA
jgi:thioredoxin-related protein